MANDIYNFFSLFDKLEMLIALTMSYDNLFHKMPNHAEKKSARILTVELDTNNSCL